VCTFLLVRRRDPLEIDACKMYIGSSIGQYEVYRNKWHNLLRSCVLSGKHIVSCNDCLMDFKDDINDVKASLISMGIRYVSDQRRSNLGYLLDPS
jgi:hypothetical protein